MNVSLGSCSDSAQLITKTVDHVAYGSARSVRWFRFDSEGSLSTIECGSSCGPFIRLECVVDDASIRIIVLMHPQNTKIWLKIRAFNAFVF